MKRPEVPNELVSHKCQGFETIRPEAVLRAFVAVIPSMGRKGSKFPR